VISLTAFGLGRNAWDRVTDGLTLSHRLRGQGKLMAQSSGNKARCTDPAAPVACGKGVAIGIAAFAGYLGVQLLEATRDLMSAGSFWAAHRKLVSESSPALKCWPSSNPSSTRIALRRVAGEPISGPRC